MSVLTKKQKKVFGPKVYTENGTTYRITATVRHDDECGNGHNSFGITGEIDRQSKGGRWIEDSCGMLHDEIKRHFPELAPFIKWHLTSTDGPLHYIANTLYWVQQGNIEYARKTAVWPEANAEELTKENLEARLPALLTEFRQAVESLGLTY